jgi:hypothetical protein
MVGIISPVEIHSHHRNTNSRRFYRCEVNTKMQEGRYLILSKVMQYTLPCIVVSTDRPPPQYVSIAKQSLIGSWQCENLFVGLHNPHSNSQTTAQTYSHRNSESINHRRMGIARGNASNRWSAGPVFLHDLIKVLTEAILDGVELGLCCRCCFFCSLDSSFQKIDINQSTRCKGFGVDCSRSCGC